MKKRLISIGILIAYSAILIKVLVFKDLPVIRIGVLRLNFGGTHEGPANLIPFKTILPYLLGKGGLIIAGINILGNIVLLVPIGFLVPFVYRNMTWKKTLVLAASAGLAIEGMQVILHVGIFDIDDVILNGVGVMVGYWAFTIFPKMVGYMISHKIVFAAVMIIISAVAFYGVYFFSEKPTANGFPKSIDPCNGTGGIGQIVSVGTHSITIKRRDGVIQIIMLSDQTTIRNSVGSIAASNLKIGERVTLVVETKNQDGSMNATAVLVCNAPTPELAK